MIDDTIFDVPIGTIHYAYVMSKMTVVLEKDLKQRGSYTKMNFVEFLEFLARVASLIFDNSELENIPLSEKLEYFFSDMFKIIERKYERNIIVVHEFSDSDDDY